VPSSLRSFQRKEAPASRLKSEGSNALHPMGVATECLHWSLADDEDARRGSFLG
jgi:hypothetical protein